MNIETIGANLMATAVIPAIIAIGTAALYANYPNHQKSNALIGLMIVITSALLVAGSLMWIWG